MTIESILRRKGTNVATIAPEASVRRAADWLRAKNIGALVVTSDNAVLGLISEREIVHAFSRVGETAGSMAVKEIMQYGVTTVRQTSYVMSTTRGVDRSGLGSSSCPRFAIFIPLSATPTH